MKVKISCIKRLKKNNQKENKVKLHSIMSLFRRPKKPMQRRVFSAIDDEENNENSIGSDTRIIDDDNSDDKMDIDIPLGQPASGNSQLKEKKSKSSDNKSTVKQKSLLSFGDDGKSKD